MKPTKLPLQALRLSNFKAVRDSGSIQFTPLTVFIGNNGSGKSSILEALEALQTMVISGLDEAMRPWHGFEHIWNKAVDHEKKEGQTGLHSLSNPMVFEVSGTGIEAVLHVSATEDRNKVFFAFYDRSPFSQSEADVESAMERFGTFEIFDRDLRRFVADWQFLNLVPTAMLSPLPQKRSVDRVQLAKDGSNIAQFLLSMGAPDSQAFKGLIETARTVLPYATDLTPAITSELDRNVYLRMREQGIVEPLAGWLLSQGTLRLTALLATFRHPNPPTVVFIEEIENGLDPRAIHLLIEEIRLFISGGGQVVVTTHSPFLLDLCDLSQIVVVERNRSGAPEFRRPSKRKLGEWAKKFTAGRLYTMGNLTKR